MYMHAVLCALAPVIMPVLVLHHGGTGYFDLMTQSGEAYAPSSAFKCIHYIYMHNLYRLINYVYIC